MKANLNARRGMAPEDMSIADRRDCERALAPEASQPSILDEAALPDRTRLSVKARQEAEAALAAAK